MTGLIYVGIIAVWAIVLVPAWLRRHDHRDPERSVDRFTRSLEALAQRDTVLGIRLGAHASEQPQEPDQHADAAPEVLRIRGENLTAPGGRPSGAQAGGTAAHGRTARSTTARTAAARRRVVLGVLSLALVGVAGLVVGGVLLPIALAAPAALLVTFVVTARHQVRSAARRRSATPARRPANQPSAQRQPSHSAPAQSERTWEARPATLPTYVTAPPAAEFPRVIDTQTPGAWTAAAMLERAQQQKARSERMAAARAEAIARAQAEQAAAEARSRDEEYLAQQSAAWAAQDITAPIYPPRAVNE